MDKKKDAVMFANVKQMCCMNTLLEVGLCAIAAGVITLAIGGHYFYKTVRAFRSDDSNIINEMFECLDKNV